MQNEMVDSLRTKLERYHLSTSSGEEWSESHALSVFLRGIVDPLFETYVSMQRSKNGNLNDAVLALRNFDRESSEKRSEKSEFKNTVRRMIEDKEIIVD
eukprot:13878979-Ditylum_brightwellii.AAC.1